MATYLWYPTGSGPWSSPGNWFGLPSGAHPAGPPVAGDYAELDTAGALISGTGAADYVLDGASVTFTGTITAATFATPDSSAPYVPAINSSLNGGAISATSQLLIGANTTLAVDQAATLAGPAASSAVGFDDFGVITVAGFSTVTAYDMNVFGTLLVASGLVKATTLEVASYDGPYLTESGSLDVGGGGSITDTLGIVGNSATNTSTVTVEGGKWDNAQLLVGGAENGVLAISADGTVTAAGGFTVVPQVTQAFVVGSAVNGPSGLVPGAGTLSVDGTGSRLSVGADAAMGFAGNASVTLSNDGLMDVAGTLLAGASYGALNGSATIDIGAGGALLQVGGAATLGAGGSASVSVGAGGSLTVAALLDLGAVAGGSGTVTVDGGLLTASADANLGDAGGGSLTLTAGGTVTVGGTLAEGVQSGATGSLVLDDAAASLSVGGDWIIGKAGAHSDSITAGVVVPVTGGVTLGSAAGGAGTLSLDAASATLMDGADLTVGDAGAGTLTIGGGATLEAFSGGLAVGASKGGAGSLTLEGNQTALHIGKGATIGGGGAGTVSVGANSSLDISQGALTLGATSGGAGTLMLAAGVTIAPGGAVTVGDGGTGSIDLAAQASLDASGDTLALGVQNGATGVVSLSGSASSLGVVAMTVGDAGAGTLSIAADATADDAGDLAIGASNGGNGTVTVAASGELSVGGNLTVGNAGSASLDVNAGTLAITSGNIVIGGLAGSNADMSVESTQLTTTGKITVGQSGTATLSVNQKGGVSAITLAIGSGFNGNGSFVLDGSGATADVNMLTVGGSGVGALQVTDKGLFTATGNATFASQGTAVQQNASIGTKGSLIVGGVLDVAKAGNALLTVDGAGLVTAPTVIVGDAAAATGTLALSGTNGALASSLQYGTLLEIAKAGSGSLSIADGAVVTAAAAHTGTVEIGVSAGATGEVTVSGGKAELSAALLTLGGGKSAAGGAGTLEIGYGGTVAADAATIWQGGTVTLSGGTLDPDPFTNNGGIGGFGMVAGAIMNSGTIAAGGGTLTLTGSVDGTGTLVVTPGALLDVEQGVASSQSIALAGGTLQVDAPLAMLGTIDTFAAGATVLLSGVTADGDGFAGGVLTLTDAGTTVDTIAISGSFTSADFHLASGSGGTSVSIACFAEGTRIALAEGWRAVEDVRPGDVVRLADGGTERVIWTGHRRLRCARHPRPADVMPVRVAAHAFGEGRPERDLVLSPDHAVFIDGMLIPVRYLLNGATMRQERVALVTYWHVELPRHAVLLAEGLPAESYLDTGNRAAFANAGTVAEAAPEFARAVWASDACAELVVAGARVASVRRALLARAQRMGFVRTGDPDLTLRAEGRPVPLRRVAAGWEAALPRGVRSLRLRSRAFVPAEMFADGTDPRRLGVAVSAMALDGEALPLDDARLGAGWHPAEPGWRWTDGEGEIHAGGARHLWLATGIAGSYWHPPDRSRQKLVSGMALV